MMRDANARENTLYWKKSPSVQEAGDHHTMTVSRTAAHSPTRGRRFVLTKGGKPMSDDALEWDTRGEEFRGTEDEDFSRPSQALIDYARSNHIQMNLWSRLVQHVLQLRMQHPEWKATPSQAESRDWLHW
jgi:hypothetical protein